ncbi:MAG: hypothetical protein QOK43_2189 [Acidimicrobiaceae bacterium]|nr:hypothetical protein [Acidimicrobiaceae bacterium]
MTDQTGLVALDLPRWPNITDEDIAAAEDVLRSGVLNMRSSAVVRAFEAKFGGYHGGHKAVVVANGTAAIHLALIACDIGPGDEVIVPTHTFVGAAAPVLYAGATPVFADVDEVTHCVSVATVEPLITPQTRAVTVVHLNGYPVDIDPLLSILAPQGIVVIEDCAQALGSTSRGIPVGTFGRVSTFSFFEQKVITAGGEGGAVVTNDGALADRLDLLRQHAEASRTADDARFWSHELGYNYRLSPVQTAIVSSQFDRLGDLVRRQRRNAHLYAEVLRDETRLVLPVEPQAGQHSFWRYAVRVTREAGVPAGEIADRLQRRGIPSRLRYPFPVHVQPPFDDRSCLSMAERLSHELITLPVHATMDACHVERVAEAVIQVLDE